MEISKFYRKLIEQDLKFSTDSRNIPEGAVFFALKGENFNGNLFAQESLEKGASYAVVDEGDYHDERIIKVNDVLDFFKELATFHRNCFDIPVLAIAGSNGKTTTKNLLAQCISKKYKTHFTAGNFNNQIGVPITLLQMPEDTEFAIIELGTNYPGEVEILCNIANPTHGIITNIGKEHLEGFGTLEAVAKEESELYLYLEKHNGTAFINADDEWLSRMSRRLEHKVLYSKGNYKNVSLIPEIEFDYHDLHFNSSLMGDYNLDNIAAAVSISEHFGVGLEKVRDAVNAYTAGDNRSQIIRTNHNMIWLDAYNANPSSMEKSIANFKNLGHENKILILGDMFELGEQATEEHNALLQWATSLGFSEILLLGDEFKKVAPHSGLEAFKSMEALLEHIKVKEYRDSAFLIKGSRGMRMETAVEAIP
ncbi:UDP-N-acetylmuramoyl-tripeptide--D-alanyl-D-alanine ligase [bacterium]|nr:UDP-N-acetylmuramoyl-tripeptide--D-alanyl-D-alanine ligase [bacterium]